MRDDFSLKTKEELAKRVAYKCSNPHCRKPTVGPKESKSGIINIGEAAHICAASPGGKRYDPNMSSEKRASESNGIWLCRNCAALIDRDEGYYTVEMLLAWKQLAEMEANQNITRGRNYTEQAVISDNDKNVIEEIIRVVETYNTPYMLREHDYHNDFQREFLNPIFSLMNYLQQPSATINNLQLREKVQDFLECIEEFRVMIALNGGPFEYGNGSYIIDFEENQKATNNLCDTIWEKYESLVTVYRMFG